MHLKKKFAAFVDKDIPVSDIGIKVKDIVSLVKVIISLKLTHVFRSKLTHPLTGGSVG